MSESMERMPAIPPEQMTPAQRAAADEIAAGRRGGVIGPFIAALRSPECMRRLQHLGSYLRYDSSIEPRLRELVILLTARKYTQGFEWVTHEPLAREAGLSPALIDAVRRGTAPSALAADEAVVVELCAVLLADGRVPDALYTRALNVLGESGVVDVICTVGYYTTLALIMNATRTALPGAAAPPQWR